MTDFSQVTGEASMFIENLAALWVAIEGDVVTEADGMALEACRVLLHYISAESGPSNLNDVVGVHNMLAEGDQEEVVQLRQRCVNGKLAFYPDIVEREVKPKYILTDGGFVIQELGEDGNYRMVGRVAKRNGDDPGPRLLALLNARET